MRPHGRGSSQQPPRIVVVLDHEHGDAGEIGELLRGITRGGQLDVLHLTLTGTIVRDEQRQPHHERCAAPDAGTEGLHGPAMQFHEVPHNAQPESKPA